MEGVVAGLSEPLGQKDLVPMRTWGFTGRYCVFSLCCLLYHLDQQPQVVSALLALLISLPTTEEQRKPDLREPRHEAPQSLGARAVVVRVPHANPRPLSLQFCAELNQPVLPNIRKWRGPRGCWRSLVAEKPSSLLQKVRWAVQPRLCFPYISADSPCPQARVFYAFLC